MTSRTDSKKHTKSRPERTAARAAGKSTIERCSEETFEESCVWRGRPVRSHGDACKRHAIGRSVNDFQYLALASWLLYEEQDWGDRLMAYSGKLTRSMSQKPADDEPSFSVEGTTDAEACANGRKSLISRRIMHKAFPILGDHAPTGVAVYRDGIPIDCTAVEQSVVINESDYRFEVRHNPGDTDKPWQAVLITPDGEQIEPCESELAARKHKFSLVPAAAAAILNKE